MKHIIIVAAVLLCIGCKKKEDSKKTEDINSVASIIGLQFEHRYKISTYSNPAVGSDTIMFHSNGTITESRGVYGDTTYPAVMVIGSNGSTAILKDGYSIKVKIQSANHLSKYAFMKQQALSGDSVTVSTFLSGDIAVNNTAHLGCAFRNVNMWLH